MTRTHATARDEAFLTERGWRDRGDGTWVSPTTGISYPISNALDIERWHEAAFESDGQGRDAEVKDAI